MVANSTRYRRSQVGRDLKPYVVYTIKQTTKTRYFYPLVLFSRSSFLKKLRSPLF